MRKYQILRIIYVILDIVLTHSIISCYFILPQAFWWIPIDESSIFIRSNIILQTIPYLMEQISMWTCEEINSTGCKDIGLYSKRTSTESNFAVKEAVQAELAEIWLRQVQSRNSNWDCQSQCLATSRSRNSSSLSVVICWKIWFKGIRRSMKPCLMTKNLFQEHRFVIHADITTSPASYFLYSYAALIRNYQDELKVAFVGSERATSSV